jgi:hypothetical protein
MQFSDARRMRLKISRGRQGAVHALPAFIELLFTKSLSLHFPTCSCRANVLNRT